MYIIERASAERDPSILFVEQGRPAELDPAIVFLIKEGPHGTNGI
jgi:hypothetical protein